MARTEFLSDIKFWRKLAVATAIVWIVAQIIVIARFWGTPQYTDMGDYIALAKRCFAAGEWYPMIDDVHSNCIVALGFINYLILQQHVFGTVDFNPVLNLFLNIAMMLQVCHLGKKFFSERAGLIAAVIFCLMLSNLFIIVGANTENPFVFLCMSALCLVFSGKWRLAIGAAPLFALANSIRPLAVIFLFAAVVHFVITKAKLRNYAALLVTYALCLFLIGTFTEKKIGYFVYQSTTSGNNLLQVANDNAKGTTMTYGSERMFIDNIETLTFLQRDSVWSARAYSWIKENPVKYASGYLLRIPGLYVHDHWALMSHWQKPDSWLAWHESDGATARSAFVSRMVKNVLMSIPYYIAFAFFFYAVWVNRRSLLFAKSIFLIIFVTGTLATCLYPVAFRYHYPFMFAVIIVAGWGADTFLTKNITRGSYTKKERAGK